MQEEIPIENDDRDDDILNVIIRNATRLKQLTEGLYIFKDIVEFHGSRMWGENNPDGKGEAFTINLPVDK